MFWGLIMEPNKRYSQTVEKAFHLSMASLDTSTPGPGLVQVMICYESRNYLLCSLSKDQFWQVPLDLNFQEGTKISFTCNGDGHVHLTGYLIPEDDGLDEMDDFSEEEEEEEEIPQLVDLKKRKQNSLADHLKKVKKSKLEIDEEDDDESDDDEDGLEIDDDDSDDSDDDLDGEEDEEDDDDEDDSDDDDEDDEEELVKDLKTQKQKQAQQNQQNHQVQNKQQNKKDKSQLVNGKDAKTQKEQGKQKKNKDDSKSDSEPQKKKTVEGGVQIEDVKVGTGAPAKAGKFVSVYYIGRLKNGKKFDATMQGEGFKFRLGKGEVIKGWDIGIVGMKVGGKRRISIPPNMAYGAKGSPPVIPPNSPLNFEVELKAVH